MASRIKSSESMLLVIDIQEKLAPALLDSEKVISTSINLVKAAQVLGLPTLVTEQYPDGLGQTVKVVRDVLPDQKAYHKMTFSCVQDLETKNRIEQIGRKQVVVCGMEAHVCVLQSVFDLLEAGYEVFVVSDAVSSRSQDNKKLGLERMRQAGAQIVVTEMVLFEWLGQAGTPEFKKLLPLIK